MSSSAAKTNGDDKGQSDLTEAWKDFREFWRGYARNADEYPEKFEGDGEEPILPLSQRKQWKDLVLHPRDLHCLEKGTFSKALEKRAKQSDLKKIDIALGKTLFSLKAVPKKQSKVPTSSVRPVVPQPFYGSPLNPLIVTVYNDPGYNGALDANHEAAKDGEALQREIEWQRANLDQLRSAGENSTTHSQDNWDKFGWNSNENVLVPWRAKGAYADVSGPGWFIKTFFPRTGSRTSGKHLAWELLKAESQSDDASCDFTDEEAVQGLLGPPRDYLFHLDIFPYQFGDKGKSPIDEVNRFNEAGRWFPSQIAALRLLKALMLKDTDETHPGPIFIIRDAQKIPVIKRWMMQDTENREKITHVFRTRVFNITGLNTGLFINNICRSLRSCDLGSGDAMRRFLSNTAGEQARNCGRTFLD